MQTTLPPSMPPSMVAANVIAPDALAECLALGQKLVVVDCRCFVDYNLAHIRTAVNAFYARIVRRRIEQNKVRTTGV
jgi:hypothetical protein